MKSSCGKNRKNKEAAGKFRKASAYYRMENPWHYRNKAISTFTYVKGKQVQTGIYAQGTHWVIPVETCLCISRFWTKP